MINRRKALGAFTGGVVAAPELAKQAAQMGTGQINKLPWSAPTVDYLDKGCEANSSAEAMRREIDTYTKIINGEFTEHQQRDLECRHRKFSLRQANIDCLKSVSNGYKIQMDITAEREHQKEQWVNDALYRLGFLKRGLWP
jgi:hypothetical protein